MPPIGPDGKLARPRPKPKPSRSAPSSAPAADLAQQRHAAPPPKPQPRPNPAPSRAPVSDRDVDAQPHSSPPAHKQPLKQYTPRPIPKAAIRNEDARDEIRKAVNTSGPPKPHRPTPLERQLPRSGTFRHQELERRQAAQALQKLFEGKTVREQTEGRQSLQRLNLVSRPQPRTRRSTRHRVTIDLPGARGVHTGQKATVRNGSIDRVDHPKTAVEKVTDTILHELGSKLLGGGNRSTTQQLGVGFNADTSALGRKIATRGVLAGGRTALGALGSGLDRPSAGVESAIGKALVATGAIKGDTAKRIRKARGPLDVFVHGRRHGKDVSGADIVQGLGGPRQAGLAVDLATDPLMYLGV